MGKIEFKDVPRVMRFERYTDILDYMRMIKNASEMDWNALQEKYQDIPDIDLADEFPDEVERLRLFEYRMTAQCIVCMYETWEQDLFNFLTEHRFYTSRDNTFANTKTAYKQHFPGISVDTGKLNEMRLVVNAIKHGSSSALNQVIALLGPSILKDSNFSKMKEDGSIEKIKEHEFDANTLTSITLNLDGKLDVYYEAIVKFWNQTFDALNDLTASSTTSL